MAKYNLEFKLKVVQEYLSKTTSYSQLVKKYNMKSNKLIRIWVNAYKTLGVKGLERSRQKKVYSVELKLKAINLYENTGKSYQDIANELGLNNPSLLGYWRKIYREQGLEGLTQSTRRPSSMKQSEKDKFNRELDQELSSLTDLETAKQIIKDLRSERRADQIKIEYLEQLRSLRLQKAMKTKQESSTNSGTKDTP